MTETATVQMIKGTTAVLGCESTSGACESCAGSMFCNVKKRTYEALIDPGLSIQEGDTVRVYSPPGKTVLAGFMVLIAPLILFLLFYILAGSVLKVAGEGGKALFGVLGLFLGFLISFLYGRRNRRNNMPRIIEKI